MNMNLVAAATLEKEREYLKKALALRRPNSGSQDGWDEAEGGEETLQQSITESEALGKERQLRLVGLALGRIRSDSYGICTDCGEAISPERLEVLPWTDFCFNCQQRMEDRFHSILGH